MNFNQATLDEMTFGDWIVYFRKQQPGKMTQRDLAQATGISASCICQIELDRSWFTGRSPRVSDHQLRALAAALGVPEEVMFSRARCQGQEQP